MISALGGTVPTSPLLPSPLSITPDPRGLHMRLTRFANRSAVAALALMSFFSCQDHRVTEPSIEADQADVITIGSIGPRFNATLAAQTVVAASDIAQCTKTGDEATALLIDNI